MTLEQYQDQERECVSIVYDKILPILNGKPLMQCLSVASRLKDAINANTTFNLDDVKALDNKNTTIKNLEERFAY